MTHRERKMETEKKRRRRGRKTRQIRRRMGEIRL